jgi:hypothetical protein
MKNTGTRIYSLIGSLILSCFAVAQTTFMKVYPTNYDKTSRDVLPTSDGGYLIVGSTNNSTLNDCDAYVMKTNSAGDTISTKTFGGNKPDYLYSMVETTDGNFFALGYSQSFNGGDYDIYLLKLSPSGNLIWQKNYGSWGNEEGREIIQTSDGNYVFIGQSNSGVSSTDICMMKIDNDGNVIWTKYYGGSNAEFGNSVKQCSDGGFIITGQTFSYGSGGGDAWLVKTDSDGNYSWDKTFGGPFDDEGISIVTNSDGSHVFAVRDSSSGQDVDVRVIKTDGSGNVLWNKLYAGNKKDTPKTLRKTSDGGFIVGAISRSFGWINPDMWLLKLDANGDTTWSRHYGWVDHEHCHSARQSSDGGYLAVGHSRSNSPNQKIMFLKLNGNGELAVSVKEQVSSVQIFKVYPNPSVSGKVKIELKNQARSVCYISNILGQIIYSESIDPGNQTETRTIDLSNNEAGMYFVTLHSKDFTTTKKLILK